MNVIYLLIFLVVIIVAIFLYKKINNVSKKEMWGMNVLNEAMTNNNWRKVVYTDSDMQVALMNIRPGQELGNEVHPHNTQFFHIINGKAEITTNNDGKNKEKNTKQFGPGEIVVIPKNCEHNVKAIGQDSLKLYTIYTPKHHPENTIDETKEDEQIRETDGGSNNPMKKWWL